MFQKIVDVYAVAIFSSCCPEIRPWRHWAKSEMSWEPEWRTGPHSGSKSATPTRSWRPTWLLAVTKCTAYTWRSVSFPFPSKDWSKRFNIRKAKKKKKSTRKSCKCIFCALGAEQRSVYFAAEGWNESSGTEAPEDSGAGGTFFAILLLRSKIRFLGCHCAFF